MILYKHSAFVIILSIISIYFIKFLYIYHWISMDLCMEVIKEQICNKYNGYYSSALMSLHVFFFN